MPGGAPPFRPSSRMADEHLLVLDDAVGGADLSAMMRALGLKQVQVLEPPESPMVELIYRRRSAPIAGTGDEPILVRAIDDHFVGILLLSIEAKPGADGLARMMKGFVRAGADRERAFTPEELRAMCAEADPRRRGFALRGLAAAHLGPPDPALTTLLEAAAGDPEPAVRDDLLGAIARFGWPELLPLVERMAAADPDKAVKKRAKGLVKAFHRVRGG